MTDQPRRILARALGAKLIEAGLIPPAARRIVLDLPLNGPMMIYVEYYGDDRWLQIDFAKLVAETEIKIIEQSPPQIDQVEILICPACNQYARRFRELYADQGLDVFVCRNGHATDAETRVFIGIERGH